VAAAAAAAGENRQWLLLPILIILHIPPLPVLLLVPAPARFSQLLLGLVQFLMRSRV